MITAPPSSLAACASLAAHEPHVAGRSGRSAALYVERHLAPLRRRLVPASCDVDAAAKSSVGATRPMRECDAPPALFLTAAPLDPVASARSVLAADSAVTGLFRGPVALCLRESVLVLLED